MGVRGCNELTMIEFFKFGDVERPWEGLEGGKRQRWAGIVDSCTIDAVFGPGLFVCAVDVAN